MKRPVYSNDGADTNLLQWNTNLNCISPYRTVNTMRLGYDRQCTYNVILICVRAATVVVEKQYYIF